MTEAELHAALYTADATAAEWDRVKQQAAAYLAEAYADFLAARELAKMPPLTVEEIDTVRRYCDDQFQQSLPRCDNLDGSSLRVQPAYIEAGRYCEANAVTITDGERTAIYVPMARERPLPQKFAADR